MSSQNVVVSTKPSKDSVTSVKTSLNIDWDGCTVEDLKSWAVQALVVKLQGGWRKNGIPATLSIRALDHKPGTRSAGLTKEQLVAALSPEEKKALLAKLMAEMDEEENE